MRVHPRDHDHDHDHDDDHRHDHEHHHQNDHAQPAHTVTIEQDLLAKNDQLAGVNRAWLDARSITAVNLMSSPGSGKTTLLERTIRELGSEVPVAVIEGDQETLLDADRIRATGRPVVQINTGSGCHLDAEMLARGIRTLDPAAGSILFVENVGNLVCPSLFNLGEHRRVVVISVTEGDDKPMKYPHMFASADLVVINKVDLLPYVDFDLGQCAERARSLRPGVEVLALSATTGKGLGEWQAWLLSDR
ncbi:MAG TPA: hydrogenase nickel incorporation protein HypB [Nocardioidaceae bacterium]|nr:hydrogenase nickel incorporation protein HypB [Nocardioidaceae bacterium]